MSPNPPAVLEELRRRKREQPFRPFEIYTLDGSRYQVGDRWTYAGNERVVSVLGASDRSFRIPISKIKALKDMVIGVGD